MAMELQGWLHALRSQSGEVDPAVRCLFKSSSLSLCHQTLRPRCNWESPGSVFNASRLWTLTLTGCWSYFQYYFIYTRKSDAQPNSLLSLSLLSRVRPISSSFAFNTGAWDNLHVKWESRFPPCHQRLRNPVLNRICRYIRTMCWSHCSRIG